MKLTTNRIISVIIILSLLLGIGAVTAECFSIEVNAAESFSYEHDPRLNSSAMNDITEDKTAVNDSLLGWISTAVIYPDTTVHYEIHNNPGDTPDSGTLIESGKQKFDTCGYKTIKLNKQYFLKKGDTYWLLYRYR